MMREKTEQKKLLPPPSNSDSVMVKSAQSGNIEAMSWLYDKYRRRIYNLCLRMLRDQADAEDLTQDVFVQLFRKIDTFRGESAFSTWLHRLAVNMVLMNIRSRNSKRYSLIPIESSNEEDDSLYEELGKEDEGLRSSLDRMTISGALDNLPPGYRMVFLLHDVHGYEHQEIAEILSCSVGNCKSQLHKARLKMRRFIERQASQPGERHISIAA
ncbi:MAG TPA: RNA polymerase sigma factor [Terriglobales bacterium]|jgi:RNA polymerase sigma-70 factor (ECF subfamily)|nr:RNA polymerase sigma factor [Terriglobales bacterium]